MLSKKANAVVVLLQLSAKQTHAYWITTFESYSGAIRYENSIQVDLVADGSASVTDFAIVLTITAGRSTVSSSLLRLEGSFTAVEVLSIASTF